MANFNTDTLKTLMNLCRIECTNEEREKLLKTLKSILNYIDLLKEVDTDGIPTCNHILETVHNVMREDKTEPPLKRNTFLKNSPSHIGGMIRVPPVIKF